MNRPASRTNGFTLIELMIVVVIIGILAALALPRFWASTTKTRQSEAKLVLKQICTMELTYRANSASSTYYTSAATGTASTPDVFVDLGVIIPENALYSYTIVPSAGRFIATATADLDGDGYDDIWTIDYEGFLTNVQNDATN